MEFYVQYPDSHVEIWDHNRWFYNFVLPGDKVYYPSEWRYAPVDGSNYTISIRDRLKKIYDNQPKQLNLFKEINKNENIHF